MSSRMTSAVEKFSKSRTESAKVDLLPSDGSNADKRSADSTHSDFTAADLECARAGRTGTAGAGARCGLVKFF